jgi:hypothetical protein
MSRQVGAPTDATYPQLPDLLESPLMSVGVLRT